MISWEYNANKSREKEGLHSQTNLPGHTLRPQNDHISEGYFFILAIFPVNWTSLCTIEQLVSSHPLMNDLKSRSQTAM